MVEERRGYEEGSPHALCRYARAKTLSTHALSRGIERKALNRLPLNAPAERVSLFHLGSTRHFPLDVSLCSRALLCKRSASRSACACASASHAG